MKNFLLLVLFTLSALLMSSCGKKETERTLVQIKGPAGLICEIAGLSFKRSEFPLSPGDYVIGFSAPGYRQEYRKVSVPARKVFAYEADLKPVTASVLIVTTPAGATVTMDGKSVGVTPLVLQNQSCGVYRGEVAMRGYAQMPLSWEVNSERPVAVRANLDSNQGSVQITSSPKGARVIVDGNEVGQTPLLLEREEGKYVIRVERAGCTPEERNIRITKGQKGRIHVRLGQRPGGVTVTSRPAGAELYINDLKRGVTPCTVEALAPGKYTLKLLRQGYDPAETQVNIIAGATDKRHFNLVSCTGSVVFNVRPVGVEVFLNGKSLGHTRPVAEGSKSTQDFRVSNLAPGKYTVTMFHTLGDPPRQSFTFRVKKNQSTTVKAVEMWIANCEIVLNNGEVVRGFLRDTKPDRVIFSPEPSVEYPVYRRNIKKLIMLDEKKAGSSTK